jgi:hypothetical protein
VITGIAILIMVASLVGLVVSLLRRRGSSGASPRTWWRRFRDGFWGL